jgi:hypothetical protein
MSREAEVFVLDVLRAVEERDIERLPSMYHPEIEFHWPPALPYGGVFKGAEVGPMSQTFAGIWGPLQPTEQERRMNARVVASDGPDVVVNYCWRGRDAAGRTCAIETLAHYRERDGKLARAQMFHFDLAGLLDFLAKATPDA